MTSSTLSVDRRWASTRKGGMTVLGKVAVPKPINLPSQRLENHGLDPNVEIVPKGTLSWGSRSSSSTSNPWGSSTLSPNTDGGTNSPGRFSTRPSSGETGTRPSTAGSDRVHDSTPSAWSSNSRPSSASGALTSSQTSLASLRPRSAETRPSSSSQLSRFAELPNETSGARNYEKLVAASFKNDAFSLSTGDFPTLGSVKSSSGKNTDSVSHDSGSSAGNVPAKESTKNYAAGEASSNIDGRSNVDNAWRSDSPRYSEDSHAHGPEKWSGDPQHYQNSGIVPPHFSAWHGPSLNNPQGGVWFRGPPGGPPPFGVPIPPGGFPMEPFPYFRPQLSANARPSAQPLGNGPRGHHPNSGEMYRPHMPDAAYMLPAMPMRPGFYPGPVPYDGYFGPPGPPIVYCNPNDRDIPLMSMGGGPPSIYGKFPNQNPPDTGHSHIRSPGYGPNNKDSNPEGIESGCHRDGREQKRVLLRERDGWDEKVEEHKPGGIARTHESSMRKAEQFAASSWDDDWEGDREKVLDIAQLSREASSHQFERRHGDFTIKATTPENVEVARVDRAPVKRSDHKRVVSPDTPKDSTLIQKIQGLNVKARASDARQDVMVVSDRLGQGNKQISDAKFSPMPESGTTLLIGSVQVQSGFPMDEKRPVQTIAGGANTSRRHSHAVQGKGPHCAKGRYNTEEVDRWQKKSMALEDSGPILPSPAETSDVVVQAHAASPRANNVSATRYPQKDERGSLPLASGPSDNQAERAKMRELARQRAKQRQEEEEQRIRDQKAKARMKLEELDRRRQAVDGSNAEPENGIQNNLPPIIEATEASAKSTSSPSPASSSNLAIQTGLNRVDGDDKSNVQKEANIANADGHNNSTKVPDNNNSKPARSSDKRKQNSVSERSCTLKPAVEAPICEVAVTTSTEIVTKESNTSFEASVSVGSGNVADTSAHHKRKFNKSGRNKFKVDESASAPALLLAASKEASSGISSVDSRKMQQQAPESEKGLVSVQPPSTEQRPALANEEAQVRLNNQSKFQPSRRTPRNQPGSRASEKFHGGDAVVWTPVRSQSKTEVADEPGEKIVEGLSSSSAKGDSAVVENSSSLRNKRTEMERYVPKPVAKEMAQQVGAHHNTSVADIQVKEEEEAVQRADLRSISGLEKEARNLDGIGRRSKSGRGHGSWRQRGLPVHHQGAPDEEQSQSDTARPGGIVENLSLHHDRQIITEENLGKEEQPKNHHDDWVLNEEPGNSSDSAPQAVTVPVVRDQGVGGKGRRDALRVQKAFGPGTHMDQKKNSSGETERSSNPSLLAPETNAAVAPKENHGSGERTALHWQPKPRASSGQNYRGSRVVNRDELSSHGSGAPHHDKEPHDQVIPGKEKTGESDSSNEWSKHSFTSPNQGSHVTDDHHYHQEAGFSSGPRRSYGNQNSRPGSSSDDNLGEWNSSRQYNNAPGHRGERQRYSQQEQHYKYQPVGEIHQGDHRSSSNQFEGGSRDGPPQNTGSRRYKERGGGHHGEGNSRRGGGNFYERQGGNNA